MRSSLVFNRDIHCTGYRPSGVRKTEPGLRDNECAPDCQDSDGKNIEAMEHYTQLKSVYVAKGDIDAPY